MKVLYTTPNPTDALAFYRGTGVLRRLRQEYADFEYHHTDSVNWSVVAAHDLVFIQRPYESSYLEIAKIAKKCNVPVVLDYDDWLFSLPESNPAQVIFKNAEPITLEIAKLADHIMVATEHLKTLYAGLGITKVTVVPNAYDMKLFKYREKDPGRNRIVLWRGGNSHLQDIGSVLPAFEGLMDAHPEWQFVFMAQKPWFLSRPHKNLHFIEGQGIYEYMKCVHDIAPSIMTHPLTDCDFNRAKSMCSYIEASHARAAFVGCDFEEFKRPGITNYKAGDNQSFFDAIDGLIKNPHKIIENALIGEKEIMSNLSLSKVNEIRYQVFKDQLAASNK